ncbi:NADH-ubiquinone reductase complex 1 MLRQ subunit [Penicillium concentricum]|uniref:NADH-ubiquinone reductase complex 1 MLRQ subunit n=1 Tax=Penicillium concentricum TaxID=293559 RepID=A0A9W9VIJ5_9EURO|nr:NADH-ubiquinone reductase complex 1 MLRQ subunit [Penicillium concentricum]KAJ5383558.1 NADH-ubiquinone reductase complex 1 MLRQ subunit [Penicillium concentricum]
MYPTRMLRMQPTRAFAFPTPKEQQSAHTISQRLRQLKRVPPELLPIGFVLAVAIGAAIYSSGKKLMTDKTLRLYRNSPESREH